MAGEKERRVAVGTPSGRRSTVWKFFVQEDEIYILSRMFGREAKVSLHSSGDCQWSLTGSWVTGAEGRKNAERHMVKWTSARPNGSTALHVFQVRIPETELRAIELNENLHKVEWLPIPPVGHTVSLECYVTPPVESDPALQSHLPHRHLFSLRLADGRWFTVLSHVPPLDGGDLEPYRSQMNALVRAEGIEPNAQQRGCLFTVSDGSARGLIELCPVKA